MGLDSRLRRIENEVIAEPAAQDDGCNVCEKLFSPSLAKLLREGVPADEIINVMCDAYARELGSPPGLKISVQIQNCRECGSPFTHAPYSYPTNTATPGAFFGYFHSGGEWEEELLGILLDLSRESGWPN